MTDTLTEQKTRIDVETSTASTDPKTTEKSEHFRVEADTLQGIKSPGEQIVNVSVNVNESQTQDVTPNNEKMKIKESNKATEISKNWLVRGMAKTGHGLGRWIKNLSFSGLAESFSWVGAVTLPLSIASGAGPLWIAAGAVPHAISAAGGWAGGINKASGREKFIYFATKGLTAGASAALTPAFSEGLRWASMADAAKLFTAVNPVEVGIAHGAKYAVDHLAPELIATGVGLAASGAATVIGSRHNK